MATLLHDLGKLRAVGSGAVRPVHYLIACHESQTLRLLDPHLERLRGRNAEVAAWLQYTLSLLATPPSGRGQAHFLGADIVVAPDQLSAALKNHCGLDDLLARTLPHRISSFPSHRPTRRHTPIVPISRAETVHCDPFLTYEPVSHDVR